MPKQNQKLGAVTVEVAIGVALAVVVVLVALGLFSENLSNMVSSSGFANMFKNHDKTTYSSFNRDYTDSQVNIQLIGEQGLAMLRNIANNKAISQIDKYFSGSDTSVTNVNSITYLAVAINAIVGSPDICVYMKKDSDKKCDQDGIGGYSYKINLNGGSISMNKVGSMGSKSPAVGGDFTSGAAGISIKAAPGTSVSAASPMSQGYSPAGISTTSIYNYIKDLSFFADQSNTVYDPVILIKALNAGNASNAALTDIITSISDVFNNSDPQKGVVASVVSAHNKCYDSLLTMDASSGDPGCGDRYTSVYPGSDSYLSDDEMNRIKNYTTTLMSSINNANNAADVENLVNTLLSNPDFIFVLENDHINNPTACQVFTDGMNSIISYYGLSIVVPMCNPL